MTDLTNPLPLRFLNASCRIPAYKIVRVRVARRCLLPLLAGYSSSASGRILAALAAVPRPTTRLGFAFYSIFSEGGACGYLGDSRTEPRAKARSPHTKHGDSKVAGGITTANGLMRVV